jgi:uncharacterized integral membrane protein
MKILVIVFCAVIGQALIGVAWDEWKLFKYRRALRRYRGLDGKWKP